MRSVGRARFPDLDELLTEINCLLEENNLPRCNKILPVADGDTANPNVIGFADTRKFVIKISLRYPDSLQKQLQIANALKHRSNLPIPEHLCYTSDSGKLPLMVMAWLPGKQLRIALQKAKCEQLDTLGKSLGRSLSVFHNPTHLELVSESESPTEFAFRLRQKVQNCIDSPSSKALLLQVEKRAIAQYLEARMKSTEDVGIYALQKADQDLRDFLVDDSYRISGMLDWEKVTRGDARSEVALIFLRFWLFNRLLGWTAFRQIYNDQAKTKISQCPQLEFYLFCRAVLSSMHSKRGIELVKRLLSGNTLPI